MSEDLQKMFIEDVSQDVDNLTGAENLSDLVIQLQKLEDEVKSAEEDLKRKKERIDKISEQAIPEIMESMKLETMKLADGSGIQVKKIYGASIGQGRSESDSDFSKRREAAFNWLREHGLGDIIKNDITVTFGMGEDNKATDYTVLAQGQGYEPVQKVGVHTSTLKVIVRERIEAGQDMPADLFKTFVGNRTKITRSK